MTPIRTQAEALVASAAALDAALIAYTGAARPAGMTDAAARVRVNMALLSAVDAAGHLGIPRGDHPLTINERTKVMNDLNRNYPTDTVAAELAAERTPEPTAPAPKRRPRIATVRATGAGMSKLQPNSTRSEVLAKIPSTEEGIAIDALDALTGFPTRPHLQKLIERGHVEAI